MKHLLASIVCWLLGHRFPTVTGWGASRMAFYCMRGCGAVAFGQALPPVDIEVHLVEVYE